MFVYSFKTSKTKAAVLLIAVLAVIIAAAMLLSNGEKPATGDSVISYKADNEQERVAFLSQFGWKISRDPVEVSEIIIPEVFDAGYSEYALMNKNQGLDLEPYQGMRAKRWTYEVLNYKGLENTGSVQANLLVFDGVVIGGDICSLELGGFIHGFEMPENAVVQTTAEPLSAVAITQPETQNHTNS